MHLVTKPEAIDLLLKHQVVAIPTETVFGLAGLATSRRAVERIFEIKQRPSDNPLICHFFDISHIQEYAEVPPLARDLLEVFSPGPFTLLLPVKDNRLQAATRGQDNVGCRIPNHPVTQELIRDVAVPLAAPSANPSGFPSSTSKEMVLHYFLEYKGGVLDGDISAIGIESTIAALNERGKKPILTILRPGSIGLLEIKKYFPKLEVLMPHGLVSESLVIPGQKYRHYSPKTPIYHISNIQYFPNFLDDVLITIPSYSTSKNTLYVHSSYKPKCIAQSLYSILTSLDEGKYMRAFWYLPELDREEGLTSLELALKNRLAKILLPFIKK